MKLKIKQKWGTSKQKLEEELCETKIGRIAKNFYWKIMSKDIAKYCRECHECQVNKSRITNMEEIMITTMPINPFDLVIVDTIGPLRKTEDKILFS